jgi:F0F1-type ATP synthase membrane subunit b/b'
MRIARKFGWLIVAAFVLISLAAAPRGAYAQTEPAQQSATDSQQAGSQQTTPAQPDSNQPDSRQTDSRQSDSHPHDSLGRRLTRETREAAGEEEDEKGVFKRSPSVRILGRALGVSVETASLLSVLFNFAIIAGLVIWLGRKYLPGMFRNRTAAIQRAMQEAQKASEDARRRLVDIEARLLRLDAEIGTMRDSAEKEAVAEEARIKAASEEEARKIVQSAEQEIAAAAKSARRDLTAYAADLAVGLAKKQIHVDAATDEGLVHDFSAQLSSAPSGPGKDAR